MVNIKNIKEDITITASGGATLVWVGTLQPGTQVMGSYLRL